MPHPQTLRHKAGQDAVLLIYKLPHFFNRDTSKANYLRLCNKILFAINYFSLSSMYHVHVMIYCVLFEPCVYISVQNRNVGALHQADDTGTAALDSHATLPSHSFSPTRTVIQYRSSGWRVQGPRQAVL